MKIVLPLLALLAAGCKSAAPGYTPTPPAPVEQVVPAEVKNPLSLMPLDLGNQWTYTLRVEEFRGGKSVGKIENAVEYRVAQARPDGTALLVLKQGEDVIDQQVWRSTGDGLYQVASGLKSVPFVPQQPLALLPLTPGRTFSWKGRGPNPNGESVSETLSSVILAPQNVDTGLGPLSAFPIETRTDYDGGNSRNTSWFRTGVGLVRLLQETTWRDGRRQTLLLTLNNYAIKRQ